MARTTVPNELVAVNAIQGTLIADNAITAVHIATNAVSGTLIADNAVTSTHIAQNHVTGTQISQNTITVTHLADNAVETAKINASAVTTAKINNGAVTEDKLAANSVTSAKIVNGTIVTADLADDAVTIAKMAALARGKIIYGDSSGAPAALALGSNGQVLKSDGTDIAWATLSTGVDGISSSADATAITIDSSERVGIGVTSPSAKLQVDGEVRVQSSTEDGTSLFSVYNENTNPDSEQFFIAMNGSGLQLGNRRNNYLDFYTNNTARMSIRAGGNIGIGTTSPDGKLGVQSATGEVGFHVGTSSSPERGNLYFDTDGSGWQFNIGKYQSSSFTSIMTFTDAGKVGIGTTSPANILHIHTDSGDEGLTIKSTGNTSNAIIFDANRSGAGSSIGEIQSKWNGTTVAMIASATGSDTTNKDDGHLLFYTSSADNIAEKMRINSSGNVGIGTTSPSGKLDIHTVDTSAYSSTGEPVETAVIHNESGSDGTGATYYSSLGMTVGAGATSQGFINYVRTADNQGSFTFSQRTGSSSYAESMRIDNSGNLAIGRTDPSRLLDVKLTATNSSLHNNSTAAVHFGSQGNADGYIQGISLGYKTDGANTYAKTAIVARGLNDGAARQSLAFLVDTAADSGSAEIGDAKLVINGTNGAVTMPAQPAFRAYLGSSFSVSAGTHTFSGSDKLTQEFDIGGNYNPSTGKFTTPVAGIYHFNATITMSANTTSVTYLSAEIIATPNGESAKRYVVGGWNSKPSTTNAYSSSAGGVTLQLAANTEVTLGYETSATINLEGGYSHTSFSGHLVA